MPITVLDNARGFEEGLQYANNVYNRIQDYAKNQQTLSVNAKIAQEQAATSQIHSMSPYFNYALSSENQTTRDNATNWYNTLNKRTTEPYTGIYDRLSQYPIYNMYGHGQQKRQ